MDDNQLIREFQEGDWEAIEKLLIKYKPLFKRLAKTPMKSVQSREVTTSYSFSSDLLSELKTEFIVYAKNFDLQSESIFAGYIKKMLTWTAFRFVKTNYDISQNESSLDQLTYELPCENDIVYDKKDDKFQELLDPLTKREKQIVTLRFFNSFSLNRIAADLKISKSTVATNIRRSLSKIKEVIRDDSSYEQKVV